MQQHAHTTLPTAATDEVHMHKHKHQHTPWMRRRVRISFSLCLSLGEPPGQHTALDVPELEALEDTHAHTDTHFKHTNTHTHTLANALLCTFSIKYTGFYSVGAVGHLSLRVKVPCLSPSMPLRHSRGSRPVAAAKCSCCGRTMVKVIKKGVSFLSN